MRPQHDPPRACLAALALLCLISSWPGGVGRAAILHVPAQYETVQGAINAAAPGDTVLIAPGEYLGSIDFNGKDIAVGSRYLVTGDTSYVAQTILRGSGTRVVRIDGHETRAARLAGLTVTGGLASNGGGVDIRYSSPTLDRLIVAGNRATTSGGGIYSTGGSPRVADCRISGNDGGQDGGGIYAGGGATEIERCTIAGNVVANRGGGIFLSGGSGFVRDCAILENRSTGYNGGGITSFISDTAIERNLIAYNSAAVVGGGIFF